MSSTQRPQNASRLRPVSTSHPNAPLVLKQRSVWLLSFMRLIMSVCWTSVTLWCIKGLAQGNVWVLLAINACKRHFQVINDTRSVGSKWSPRVSEVFSQTCRSAEYHMLLNMHLDLLKFKRKDLSNIRATVSANFTTLLLISYYMT